MEKEIIPSLEIWNNGLKSDEFRKNKISDWAIWGPDKEETFTQRVSLPANINTATYGRNDIQYKYNSYGCRSDEFINTECEILYSGCSFTEGEGLPIDAVWSSQLNKLIGGQYNKTINYHSVSRSGLSINAITRRLYAAIEQVKLRPKMIVVLFPSLFRDEFYINNFHTDYIPSMYVNNFISDRHSSEFRYYINNHEKNLRLSNVINDFYKNLLLINLLCAKYGIIFRYSTWQDNIEVSELSDENLKTMPDKYQNGQTILLGKLVEDYLPNDVKDSYISTIDINKDEDRTNGPFIQSIARDFLHPGPNHHWRIASRIFKELHPILETLYD